RERGSVLSFTGDGVVAFFSESDFTSREAVAAAALQAARKMDPVRREFGYGITLRVALHWGMVYIPVAGRLCYQAIGRHVVVAARLCDWIAKKIEIGIPEAKRGTVVAATSELHQILPKVAQEEFKQ